MKIQLYFRLRIRFIFYRDGEKVKGVTEDYQCLVIGKVRFLYLVVNWVIVMVVLFNVLWI